MDGMSTSTALFSASAFRDGCFHVQSRRSPAPQQGGWAFWATGSPYKAPDFSPKAAEVPRLLSLPNLDITFVCL